MAKTNLINLTPHAVNLGGQTIAPSGTVARVTEVKTVVAQHDGFCLITATPGDIVGLPQEQGNTIFIVSAQVRVAAPQRGDLGSPGDLIRDDQGRVIGCASLIMNDTFRKAV